ncbi:uncharacterized protein TNCV_2101191 [Trichonephila clavipes]|nr:uncharacterized protein TNCV_2101191 [Trichonephila clavipes]
MKTECIRIIYRVQAITPDDYPHRLNFATWYLQQTAENQTFPADVLFTDEATFTRSVGPYILPSRLADRTYNIFLQEVLPELLVDVPPSVHSRMWFQHDGAPAHFSRNVRNHLDTVYGQHWIGREDLVARLSVAAGHVIDMPDVFSDLSRSMRRRCECCVTVGGHTFEHLL